MVVSARKEVILSAGAVHTPQVLQLSGIGPRTLLEAAKIDVLVDLPGVGANFQDHAFLNVGYACTIPLLCNESRLMRMIQGRTAHHQFLKILRGKEILQQAMLRMTTLTVSAFGLKH